MRSSPADKVARQFYRFIIGHFRFGRCVVSSQIAPAHQEADAYSTHKVQHNVTFSG